MASTSEPAPLIFLHIPKTGGTTLHTVLRKVYGDGFFDNNQARRLGEPAYPELSPAAKANVRLVKGHLRFGFHAHAPDPSAVRYFTFLRDPVDRVESLYRHMVRVEQHPLHAEVKGIGLREFALGSLTTDVDNGHVRFVAGGLIKDDTVGQDDLDRAKQNIEEWFVYVGQMDSFRQSITGLARELGWDRVPRHKRRNVAPRTDDEIAPELVEIIRERNAYDVELKRWAAERFGFGDD